MATDFAGLETAPRLANAAMADIDALEIDEEELAQSSPLGKRIKRSSEGLHTHSKAVQTPGLLPDGWPGLSVLSHAGPSTCNKNSSSSLPFPAERPRTFSNMTPPFPALAAHERMNASQHGPSGRPGTSLPCIYVWSSYPCNFPAAHREIWKRTFFGTREAEILKPIVPDGHRSPTRPV